MFCITRLLDCSHLPQATEHGFAQDVVPLDIHHPIASRARLQCRREGRAEPAVPGHTACQHHTPAGEYPFHKTVSVCVLPRQQ